MPLNSMSLSKLLLDKYGPEPLSRSFKAPLKSLIERRIINASAEIRNDPDWTKHLGDKERRQCWLDMCAEQFKTTELDMDYIFDELEYYKALHENTPNNMALGGADMIWIKDISESDSLTLELKQYADALEVAYPKKYTCWEGGGCILRLIDPLIYPLSYYYTHVLSTPIESSEQALNVKTFGSEPGSFDAWADIVVSLNPHIEVDDKGNIYKEYYCCDYDYPFCWLPTDIRVNTDGSVVIKSYINNLHPIRYSAFYKTLSKVLAAVVIPLAEQVLTDLVHPTCPRVIVDYDQCIESGESCLHMDPRDWPDIRSFENTHEWCDLMQGIVYTEPVPRKFTKPDRPLPLPTTYSLRGEDLQIVVEMETTYLTPESPKRGHSRWRNSGVPSDKIFATAIWYYDVGNAEISDIQFRDPIGSYKETLQNRNLCESRFYKYVYGVEEYDNGQGCRLSQPAGTTGIKGGRIVCFPGLYQHIEPSMRLTDPSRYGYVRKLYFYLVHPGVHLPSTSIVAPQQLEWRAEAALSIPPLAKLPMELKAIILKEIELPFSLRRERENHIYRKDYEYRVDGEFETYQTYAWKSINYDSS